LKSILGGALVALLLSVAAHAQIAGPVQHRELPACTDTSGQHLNYNATAGTFVCGTTAPTGSAGVGLWGQTISTTPTQTSTGLTSAANFSTYSVSNNAAGITITNSSTTAGLGYIYKAAPATPYSITALVAYSGVVGNFVTCGIGWANAGLSSTQLMWEEYESGWALGDSVTSQKATYHGGIAWLKIYDDGTNIHEYGSLDGVNWFQYYTVAKSSGSLGASGYANVIFGMNTNLSGSAGSFCTMLSFAQGTS